MAYKFPIVRPIVVDTETYYDDDCSVRANKRGWVGGNYHYVTHPKFYCYMISWYDIETKERGVLDNPDHFKNFVRSLEGRTIVALNAGFDMAVLWSIDRDFQPFNTFDVGDAAQYFQFPRNLEGACKYALGREISKGMRDFMKGKHYRDIGVEKQAAMREYALSDVVNEADLYYMWVDLWPKIEQWMSDYTRRQNWKGVHIDREYLQQQMDRVGSRRVVAARSIPWVEDINEDKPLSAKKLATYCREVGIEPPESLAEDSEECVAWEKKYGDTYPVVAAIRDFRKSNTYFKKLTLVERLLRSDHTIPLATMYCAAPHTGRFSAKQFNYQSLPRDGDFCDLRGCLVPPPGNSFIVADLSGIEARCLPWLAGDMDLLSQLAVLDKQAWEAGSSGGGDIYEPHSRRMLGYSDPRPLKKTDKDLRNATKVCVLQLGYQSGSSKFCSYIEANVEPRVLDRVRRGAETNMELATRLVQLFRGTNPKIPALWYGLDRELRSNVGGTYKIQLPNGRVIEYFDLMVRTGVDQQGKARSEVIGKRCRGDADYRKLYGGKLVENISQALAREVLVDAMYRLDAEGFPINFGVHDEAVTFAPTERVTREACRRVEEIMSQTPAWVPGLPLASETAVMDRYAK